MWRSSSGSYEERGVALNVTANDGSVILDKKQSQREVL